MGPTSSGGGPLGFPSGPAGGAALGAGAHHLPPCGAGSSPPVSAHFRSALSDALVQQGLAELRTGGPLTPSPPASPSSGGGLSPPAASTPRSALTDALRHAGLRPPAVAGA